MLPTLPQNRVTRFTGLWHQPNFLKLWAGQTISQFGSQITLLAIPLTAVLLLNATPVEMGILGAVEYAPFLFLSLFAGAWVDRMSRRPILIISDVGRALLLGSIPLAGWLGWLSISYLYVAAICVGILTVFFDVAYQSYLPSLIERDQLVEGNAKLEVSRSVAQVTGPSIAGVLVQVVTAPGAILFDALSFVTSGIAMSLINKPEPSQNVHEVKKNIWREIGEGLGVVFGSRYLRSIAGCTGTINFFFSVMWAVFTLFAVRELGLTPAELGIVFGTGSIGALVGALAASPIAKRLGVGATIVSSIAISAGGLFFAPFVSGNTLGTVLLLILSQFILSFGIPVYDITQISLRQAITPLRVQGRVNASMRLLSRGAMPIGSLVGGTLGEVIGLRPTLLIAAAGGALAFLWVLLSPVRTLREQPQMIDDARTAEVSEDGRNTSTP